MPSPSLEIQGAIVAALKAASGVAAIVGSRVFDNVPRSPATGGVTAEFPFVAISGWQEITDDAECIEAAELTVTIDAWSRAVGMPEAHRLAAAVKGALHNAELTLDETALVMIEHLNTRTFRDPDGISTHAVLEFRAIVETP